VPAPYAGLAAATLGFALSSYWAWVAWTSTPESWRERNVRLRPASWDRWPVYSAIWRNVDERPARYLWIARFAAPLSAALCGVGAMVLLLAAKSQ